MRSYDPAKAFVESQERKRACDKAQKAENAKRTTLHIPRSLADELKRKADAHGLSVSRYATLKLQGRL